MLVRSASCWQSLCGIVWGFSADVGGVIACAWTAAPLWGVMLSGPGFEAVAVGALGLWASACGPDGGAKGGLGDDDGPVIGGSSGYAV